MCYLLWLLKCASQCLNISADAGVACACNFTTAAAKWLCKWPCSTVIRNVTLKPHLENLVEYSLALLHHQPL